MTYSFGPAKWAACALALFALPFPAGAARAQAPALHAGIEVGGKGVKATVVEITPDAKGNPVTVKFAKTTNTTISDFDAGKFRPEAVTETVEAVAAFLRQIEKEFGLKGDAVTVVGSSGVALASNRDDLPAAVEKATGRPMKYITAEREAELVLTGLALRGERADVLLIDIGGGNTKGGTFADGAFIPYSLGLGSVTYANKVKAAAADTPFAAAAAAMSVEQVLKPLLAQAAGRPALTERKTVYAVGGVVWAAATYTRPEMADQALVPLTAADIDAFLAKVSNGVVPDLNTDAVTDAKVKGMAVADGKRIRDNFTAEQLTAGAVILKNALVAFKADGKKLYFARNGVTAWIVAFVSPKDARADAVRPKAVVPPPPPPNGTVSAPPLYPSYSVSPSYSVPPSYPVYPSYFASTPTYSAPAVVYASGPCVCPPVVYGPTVHRTYAPQPAPRRLFQRR